MFGRLQKAGQDKARQPRIPLPDLTRLEKEILGFVVEGLANREIAEIRRARRSGGRLHPAE